jgi:membrane protein required for beta-lactamase induction
MFTLTLFTTLAILIGFFFGTFWLATAVAGVIFAKLFPMVSILIGLTAIGLVTLRHHWRRRSP